MGAVYAAEHRVMQRPVALKIINRAYTAHPATVERFRREVRAAARLSHPNIVTTYDAEDAGGSLFLVMEHVEGVSLGRLVRQRGPLPVAEACEYVRQAALGLQHAHERGMVHRDVKPDNLILNSDGTVKVLDFGLAALTAEPGDGLTNTNVVMGTPEYMAPEQAEDPHAADGRADVYSLGCTLYYLLTGSVPYPAATSLRKILAHREKALPDIRHVRPEVSPELATIIGRLLAKKTEDRYQTAGDVSAALKPFARPQLAPSSAPLTVSSGRKSQRWPRRQLLVAALLFVGVVLGGVTAYRIQTDTGELVITAESDDVEVVIKQGGKLVRIIDTKTDKQIKLALRSGVYELELEGAPERLSLNIEKVTLTRGKQTLAKIERVEKKPREAVGEVRCFLGHEAAVHSVAISPDGRLAASGSGGIWVEGHGWLLAADYTVRLWDMATGHEIRRFTGHGSTVVGLAFSPDGNLLASSGSFDQTVRIWEVATGKQLHCLQGHNARTNRIAFLPGGRHVVSAGWDGLLRIWDVKIGKQVQTFEGHEGSVDGVTVSPDGRHLASSSKDGTARLWDIETGKELRQFPGHGHTVYSVAFSPDGRRLLSTDTDSKLLRLWDVETGKELRQFVGHTAEVFEVVFTRDGHRALSSSCDTTIRLWDVETGKELHSFTGHTSTLGPIVVSPDGRYVLSGSNDKTVRLWRLPAPPPAKENP